MADLRESFPNLEILATGEGAALTLAQEADSKVDQRGQVSFVAIGPSNLLQYLKVSAEGRLLVDQEAAGTPLKASGAIVAGSATLADVTGASLTLTPDMTYTSVAAQVSCFREAIFEIVQVDDATTTVLARVLVGPGQYSFTWHQPKLEVLAGATGPQTLKVRAQNLDKLSNLSASISALEVG